MSEASRFDAHEFVEPEGAGADDRCGLCGESRSQIRHHPTRIRAAEQLAEPAEGRRHGGRTLSHEEARAVYDRVGSFQDRQAFYEDRAIDLLIRHSDFGSAHRVFEFGCGTGRLASRLLAEELPADARYQAVDVSPTMVGLAQARLEPFASRARVVLTDGTPVVDALASSADRFVSTYVLDLLSEEDVEAVLNEAHRILAPGGRLCLAGLCPGNGGLSRAVAAGWSWLHRLSPRIVGGCRPQEIVPRLSEARWRVLHHEVVTPFGVPSEVVVAERARGAQVP
ncbi:MAG: class I SAM-dependent methyltransferase [Myxococcota bacterium]|nr:class I SAM-dependent methyltransferase [Myxococcota bacterium]